jgi:hypothetical protein
MTVKHPQVPECCNAPAYTAVYSVILHVSLGKAPRFRTAIVTRDPILALETARKAVVADKDSVCAYDRIEVRECSLDDMDSKERVVFDISRCIELADWEKEHFSDEFIRLLGDLKPAA